MPARGVVNGTDNVNDQKTGRRDSRRIYTRNSCTSSIGQTEIVSSIGQLSCPGYTMSNLSSRSDSIAMVIDFVLSGASLNLNSIP